MLPSFRPRMIYFYKHWFALNCLIAWLISSRGFLHCWLNLSKPLTLLLAWNVKIQIEFTEPGSTFRGPRSLGQSHLTKAPSSGFKRESGIKHSHCLLKSRVRKINFTLLFMGSDRSEWMKKKKIFCYFNFFFLLPSSKQRNTRKTFLLFLVPLHSAAIFYWKIIKKLVRSDAGGRNVL